MSPYRKVPARELATTNAPRELVYEAVDRATTTSSAVALFRIGSLPAIIAVMLAVTINGTAGAVGLAVGLAYAIWSSRRRREGATLTVDGPQLTVVTRGPNRRTESLAIGQLHDIELDIKKIRRVQEGDSAIPAVRFINANVMPEVDTARIVLVGEGRRVTLSESYMAHVDAVEWLGKIRVFLRKHGWVPPDEREPEEPEEDEGDEAAADL